MKERSLIFRAWNLYKTPWTQEIKRSMRKNMKILRKKGNPEQLVIVSRITRLPS
jgi:hypothetical protein